MFYDVKISNEQINPNYKQWLENKGKTMDCQLSVTLLNENQWPPATRITLNPASDFVPCKAAFEDFFGCAAQKKSLAWIYQSGDTDVHYSFIPKVFIYNFSSLFFYPILSFHLSCTFFLFLIVCSLELSL